MFQWFIVAYIDASFLETNCFRSVREIHALLFTFARCSNHHYDFLFFLFIIFPDKILLIMQTQMTSLSNISVEVEQTLPHGTFSCARGESVEEASYFTITLFRYYAITLLRYFAVTLFRYYW